MPKLLSDHHPISLIFEKEDELGPIPFRFSPLWTERDGFMDIVGQAWSQYVDDSPSFISEQKLKRTKLALKTWVKIPIKTPTSSRKERVVELSEIQIEMECREITKTRLDIEQFAQFKTSQSFRQEEEHLRFKSRSLQLQEGDKNSTFFHRQCRARLSRNHITEISLGDGVVIKGQDPLKQTAWTHFQLLYHEDGLAASDVSVEFMDKIPALVNPQDNQALLKPFFEQEILDVIWAMEPNKAPVPDGFSFHFYRVCWNIIKFDLI